MGLGVAPVEVDAPAVGSEVSEVDSVRVEHWDDLEHKPGAQRAGARLVWVEEEGEQAVARKRGGSLSGVNARRDEDTRLVGEAARPHT